MAAFKKINTKIYSKPDAELSPDEIYWKKLAAPVLVKEFGPIDYIDFSPVEPYNFAVTCSVRVQIYNPITKLVTKNLSRFRENAYGGSFRSDGTLLCVGGEEAHVKLFDTNTKSLLRLFKGHEAPIHRTFFTKDKTHIASFSDDKTVRVWDLPTESVVNTFSEHTDYIRAGSVSPISSDIVLSGGYDRMVKMYDIRSNETVLNVDHGSPVETVLYLPSGGIFLSAGGTEIKVWDAFAGGRLLTKISQHHKTITCMHLANNNQRLMSGSLDRHVKVYDLLTFKAVYTLDYPNAILSLAVSKNDDTLVAGMVDGLVSISRRDDVRKPTKTERKLVSFRYTSNTHHSTVDTFVSEYKREVQSKHDICLRKFQYSKALDYVLAPYVVNKTPAVTVALMQELIRRKGLKQALAGRESKSIIQIIRFITKYIGDYRYARVLIDVANIFFDVYESEIHEQSANVKKQIIVLAKRLKEEEDLSNQMMQLQGSLHMLISASSAVEEAETDRVSHDLIQSENAKKDYVINIT